MTTDEPELPDAGDAEAPAAVAARRRRSVRTFVLVLVGVVAGLALLSTLLDDAPACDPIPGVRAGVCITAPRDRGSAPTATRSLVGGGQGSVADLQGQVVVVNFWAAWCGPCRAEQPVLNEAHDLLAGDDIAFLGVAIQDSEVNQQAHLDEFSVPYPSIFDQSNQYAALWGGIGARSIPTTVFVDREGRVAVRLFGEVLGVDEVAALTARLASETETSAAVDRS